MAALCPRLIPRRSRGWHLVLELRPCLGFGRQGLKPGLRLGQRLRLVKLCPSLCPGLGLGVGLKLRLMRLGDDETSWSQSVGPAPALTCVLRRVYIQRAAQASWQQFPTAWTCPSSATGVMRARYYSPCRLFHPWVVTCVRACARACVRFKFGA